MASNYKKTSLARPKKRSELTEEQKQESERKRKEA